MARHVILCVDDEKTVLTSLRQELSHTLGDNFTFELAESAEEGLEIIDELQDAGQSVTVVISDQIMPGMKGDVFLGEVERRIPGVGKILLTGQSAYEVGVNARDGAGHFHCLNKPWHSQELRDAVQQAAGIQG